MPDIRIRNPSGILWALYASGPSKAGVLLPIGNCVVFDVMNKCFLTASHVLRAAPKRLKYAGVEIAPEFVCFMVGVRTDSAKLLRFEVVAHIEIVPEVTALYLSSHSHTYNVPFPAEQSFQPDSKPVDILWPVIMSGVPSSIQDFDIKPDQDMMEMEYKMSTIHEYHISGMVSGCYRTSAPYFIDSNLLPVFVVDNAVLPGMSGCAVFRNIANNHKIAGMVIKNITVGQKDANGPEIVQTLCVCSSDIEV